ncbi:MAG: FAD-dependent oxidoreductase [Endozoicomonadaceae bacterium]|nr:FAD-dependent oxidoreductase [Endozoicomonadaceae bacterium]
MSSIIYDVVIIGGGVSGTALLYELAEFTDLKHLALVEKYHQVSSVNSKSSNNSQTIHYGDIETNYQLKKAIEVKKMADMLVNYSLRTLSPEQQKNIIFKYPKMVIAIGHEECLFLEKRFEAFRIIFPEMRLIEKEEIAKLEPKVALINGQFRQDKILAISIEDEYTAMNYQTLSQSFVDQAFKAQPKKNIQLYFNEEVKKIKKTPDGLFSVISENKQLTARFVVVSAGAHSLLLAHQMQYGLEFSCLPIAGSFYFTPQCLNGKVYTIQNDNLPFAAVHGDPDIGVPGQTRFGPTALILPLLERYNLKTFPQFLKLIRLDSSFFYVLWTLFRTRDIRQYILKNILFEIPLLREWLFLKDAQKIIPSLKRQDLRFAKGFGGVRPQLIDKKNRCLLMGEAKINTGEGIIFNMTPSPGATTCLGNAEQDLKEIIKYLGCQFNQDKFTKQLL